MVQTGQCLKNYFNFVQVNKFVIGLLMSLIRVLINKNENCKRIWLLLKSFAGLEQNEARFHKNWKEGRKIWSKIGIMLS